MGRQVLRDLRTVQVGTTSILVLPAHLGRILTVIGSPPPSASPTTTPSLVAGATSIATTGIKLTAQPAGASSMLVKAASYFSASTTAVVQLRLQRGGTLLTLAQFTGSTYQNLNLVVSSSDLVTWVVTTAGLGGEVGDFVFEVETYPTAPRVSLGLGVPAVLDQGITLYPGQLPLILPGAAVNTDLFAIADVASRPINVVDLFYQ